MIQPVEGIFQNGSVELLEQPNGVGTARVIVTFWPPEDAPERATAFTPEEIGELRCKLAAWEVDWNAPGMEEYDDYEARRRGAGPVSDVDMALRHTMAL